MTGSRSRVLIICSLAILFCQAKEHLAAAQNSPRASSAGLSDEAINEILVAIAKLDAKLKIIRTSDFFIENGDLAIKVKADKPIFHEGKPIQNGSPLPGLYGEVDVSQRFYGIEVVLHYLLLKGNAPSGGAFIQERVTVLYEDTSRFKPFRPRAFDSNPFPVNADGTFVDLQVFGNIGSPLPDKTLQVLRQELILDKELIATIYIARTPKEIRLLGYSVPPLISDVMLKR